jgi:hypothetical protein
MEDFLARHELQLFGMGFPSELNEVLYEKLTREIFDLGSFFKLIKRVSESNQVLSQE